MSEPVRRPRMPKRMIAIVVLAYISGILDILAGLVLILLRYDDEIRRSGDAFAITLWGTLMILIGLLTIAMGSGLTRGRNSARIFVTALVSLSVVVSAIDLVLHPTDASSLWTFVIGGTVAALVVLAMWAGRGAAFFRHARRASPPPA
ncbi:hypothetical protein [Agromyces sp. NPDC058126]|uniref:DUF7144 family membrane protein n=1 Tax=Agromyces sp. NPDC058126 TaxID=3346350 RepID=UPI0036DD167E